MENKCTKIHSKQHNINLISIRLETVHRYIYLESKISFVKSSWIDITMKIYVQEYKRTIK